MKNIPCFSASPAQLSGIAHVKKALQSKKYVTHKTSCPICGDQASSTRIATYERNGLFCPVILCDTCGLLRNEETFTQESCAEFYKNDYYLMNFGSDFATRDYFYEQNEMGLRFFSTLQSFLGNFSHKKIIEIGCSSGGILYPFQRRGNHCIGYDYNTRYMQFGKSLGLDLRLQDDNIEGDADILILSHCLEHLPDPIAELKKLKRYLKPNGILLAEVHNIYRFNNDYQSLQHYFTIAHIFHFTPYHFSEIIKRAGFMPCYQNEYTTIIAKVASVSEENFSIDASEKERLKNFLIDFSHWNKPVKPVKKENTKQKIKRYLKKSPFFPQLRNYYGKIKKAKTLLTPSCSYKTCYIAAEDITEEELELIKRHIKFYGHNNMSILHHHYSSIPDSFPVLNFCSAKTDKNTFDIDWRMNPADAWEWCRFSDYVFSSKPDLKQSKRFFFNWKSSLPQLSKAYIFGTGPSLDKAMEHTWNDGYRIVCNTIVKNRELWHHISPHVIVAGDALYHFSDENFAKLFRNDLQSRLEETPSCIFIYPSIFDGIVRRSMNISPHQLIPIPLGNTPDLHHCIKRFELPALGNVLGILLLPLASFLSKHVCLWAFDGKAPTDELFWKNSEKQHYTDDVVELRRNHPAFYSFFCPEHDNNFYEKKFFGDSLEHSLQVAEREGWTYHMLHFSWTKILNKRYK